MKDNKDKKIGSLLKQAISHSVDAPQQKVVQVKPIPLLTKFTFYLPTEKYNKLKILAVNRSTQDEKVFLKDLINDALDQAYFKE